MSTRSRWLEWEPKTQILADSPKSEPTKTTETDFGVFVGSPVAESPKIEGVFVSFVSSLPAESTKMETEPDPAELDQAHAVLNRIGVRLIELDGVPTVGLWSDLDSPEVGAALRALGWVGQPIRYLDGPGIPMRYKLRSVPGELVPISVLAAMEQAQAEPWTVRDRMLAEMRWRLRGIPHCEWSAEQLSELFRTMRQRGAKQ
jgi:hypothetical protein